MVEKLIWAAGSVGVHAALVAAVLMPPALDPAPAARQPLSVRLLADTPRPRLIGSTVLFAAPRPPSGAAPERLLAALDNPIPQVPAPAIQLTTFLPSSAMERRPVPVSEPNIASLETAASSGLPVRLRLYIDRLGKVVDVVPLVATQGDAQFVAALIRMFRATAFLPGQRAGVDVASFMDIELVAR